ncbi:MAG: hypothetical protein LKF75_04250 [Bacilli bacterium]|jgi:hypothetical protein|nr:hypothetical protein [Bacilli bacterium]MCH4228886.1 hypothetical protein [Bacilli bacterium]
MVIRKRYWAFVYRLIVLFFGFYAMTVLVKDGALDGNYWASFLTFETEVTLFSLLVVLAEVIANAIGLKMGNEGLAPGVWSPLFLCCLFYVLADTVTYFITAPIFYGTFIRDGHVQLFAISRIVYPLLLLFDYILFGEKGTVKWKHALYWMIFPFFYFWIVLATNYLWSHDWFAYPYFNIVNYASSAIPGIAANGGWGGVWIFSGILLIGFVILAYAMIFFNFLWAGAYKKREPDRIN